MKIECPNCGCLNSLSLKQDNLKLIIREFKEKTGALICILVDDEGYIIASETDESMTKSTERKIVAFHLAFQDLIQNYAELFESKSRIESISIFEEVDINLKGFIMLIKEIVNAISFISIIPSWLNLTYILPKFKRTVIKLNNSLKPSENQDYIEFTLII